MHNNILLSYAVQVCNEIQHMVISALILLILYNMFINILFFSFSAIIVPSE